MRLYGSKVESGYLVPGLGPLRSYSNTPTFTDTYVCSERVKAGCVGTMTTVCHFLCLIRGLALPLLRRRPKDLSRAEGRYRKSQEAHSATLARAKDAEKRLRTETGERERASTELAKLLEVKSLLGPQRRYNMFWRHSVSRVGTMVGAVSVPLRDGELTLQERLYEPTQAGSM